MIKINLTKTFAKDLNLEEIEDIDVPVSMTWYAHRITIARRKCIIVMEENTRYVMIFCGMTKLEFKDFPRIFFERLVVEATMIVADFDKKKSQAFFEFLEKICAKQVFQVAINRSVQSHINQVSQDLKMDVEWKGNELPVDVEGAISFGLLMNQLLRKRKGDKDYFVPLESFQLLCMNLWLKELESIYGPLPKESETNNVIEVDFKNKSRILG